MAKDISEETKYVEYLVQEHKNLCTQRILLLKKLSFIEDKLKETRKKLKRIEKESIL